MPIFKEKTDKLTCNLSDTDEEVKIHLTDYNGTVANVSFDFPPKSVDTENSTSRIGNSTELKAKNIFFSGSTNNPLGNHNKIKHTISQGNNQTTYTFPDDYSGSNEYSDTDQTVSYEFNVKFI